MEEDEIVGSYSRRLLYEPPATREQEDVIDFALLSLSHFVGCPADTSLLGLAGIPESLRLEFRRIFEMLDAVGNAVLRIGNVILVQAESGHERFSLVTRLSEEMTEWIESHPEFLHSPLELFERLSETEFHGELDMFEPA